MSRPPRAAAPRADVAGALGTEDYLNALFGSGASAIHTTYRDFTFRYASAAHWVDVFRTWYGPVHKAFAALQPEE